MLDTIDVTQFASQEERLALYDRMRRESPVHEARINGIRTLIAYRHADVDMLLKNPHALVQETPGKLPPHVGSGPASVFYRLSLPHMDRPEHAHFRRIATDAFNPRTVDRMAEWVGEIIEDALDAIGDRDEIDVIEALGAPIPAAVACRMLHIPLDHARLMLERVHDLNPIVGQAPITPEILARADAAAQFYFDYFAEHVASQTGLPDDDMLAILIAAQREGRWDSVAMATTLIGLFIASYHTTMTAIANAVHALAAHPEQRALLAADPGLAEAAWEEVLRYDSPVHFVHRYAIEPMRIGEVEAEAGTRILLGLASANLDPARFEQAGRFDIRRTGGRHLAFALGPHFCLGAQLSRLEGKLLLRGLAGRYPDFTLTDAPVERVLDMTFPHITKMRVALDPRE